MTAEQEFARYLRVIGKGPNLSRPLERPEAASAMRLVLADAVAPLQLGALLLLLRYRGETAHELAGMVDAAQEQFSAGYAGPAVDLDWPSYADRHRQQPWFVLAALLLAANGVKVLMHGVAGAAEGHAPTRPALAALGIEAAASLQEAGTRIESHNFAYIGLETFCSPLDRLFDLRPLLGVRTAINTMARALNPAAAAHQMQGVSHPPYLQLHQELAQLLDQPHAAIFKGGGGEVQRNPLKPCRVAWVAPGSAGEEDWPALLPDIAHHWRDESLEPARVAALWAGEIALPAPEAAVTGTVAVALRLLGRAADQPAAQAMAEQMWRDRQSTTAPTAGSR